VRLSSDKMRGDGDRRGGGRPADFLARTLPRTVLSAAQNADEARTAVLVRAELRRWRLLQLEPSALRQPDDLQAPSALTTEGRHLPATLYRLAGDDPDPVYADIANRLSELVNNVRGLRVDRDDARRVLRLVMTDASGVELPASSLSDGTLRFIALSVLEKDPTATGLLCLEEPENGIHPERMGAMMRLLGDMVVETYGPIGDGNPLRQVIISTHSPVVAARAQHDQLVFADHRDAPKQGDRPRRSLVIRPVAGTWRDEGRVAPLSRGDIIRFLGALQPGEAEASQATSTIYDVATSGGVQLRLFPGAAP
ncbi:MAG: ATP-binding protein, partial [Myxococcales bacterium]|nr:ATP-binding protein [Myxococcales bacterium]